jgi:hypothetical protein
LEFRNGRFDSCPRVAAPENEENIAAFAFLIALAAYDRKRVKLPTVLSYNRAERSHKMRTSVLGLRRPRSARALYAGVVAVLAGIAWMGWQLALDHERAAAIERLSTIKVSVFRHEPNQIGEIAARLPQFARNALVQLVDVDALVRPTSLTATEIGASDIDTLVQDAKRLPSLQFIVLMERQLNQADVARLRRSLPDVKIIEAVFISGVVMTR